MTPHHLILPAVSFLIAFGAIRYARRLARLLAMRVRHEREARRETSFRLESALRVARAMKESRSIRAGRRIP